MNYKLLSNIANPDGSTSPSDIILRVDDNTFIRKDESVGAYQEYLAWLAEGNEPLPADDPS